MIELWAFIGGLCLGACIGIALRSLVELEFVRSEVVGKLEPKESYCDYRYSKTTITGGAADPNVAVVQTKLAQRSAIGRAKYGTDTTRSDLTKRQWMQHLQEELLDASVYLERLMSEQPK